MNIRPDQTADVLAAGMTVMVPQLDALDPLMAGLLRRVRTELLVADGMDIACFVSPTGSGYGLHFDSSSMWILQVEGTKRWWISEEPAVVRPPDCFVPDQVERDAHVHGLHESSLKEVVLRKGDVLYLPAGAWHRPQAEGLSIHLSLTIFHGRLRELFTDVIDPILDEDPAWRAMPAPGTLVGPPEVRGDLMRQMEKRLEEFKARVATLTADQLLEAWRRRVDVPATSSAEESGSNTPIELSDQLALVPEARFTAALDPARAPDESLCLCQGGHVFVLLPRRVKPLIDAITEREHFTAGELRQSGIDLPWEHISSVLALLLDSGVLRREPAR